MIQIIIFDLWNTIIWKDHSKGGNKAMLKYLNLNLNHKKVIKIYEKHAHVRIWNSLEEPYREILKEIGVQPTKEIVDHVVKLRTSVFQNPKPFPEAEKVLKQLSQKYKLVLLTNTLSLSYEKFLETGLQKYFDYIITSFDTGLIKPDQEIFKLILKKYNIKPEECVMIGDNPTDDIEPAQKLGMKTILIDRKNKYPNMKSIKSLEEVEDELK